MREIKVYEVLPPDILERLWSSTTITTNIKDKILLLPLKKLEIPYKDICTLAGYTFHDYDGLTTIVKNKIWVNHQDTHKKAAQKAFYRHILASDKEK